MWLALALALSCSVCVPVETQLTPLLGERTPVALPLPEKESLAEVTSVSLPLPLGIHWPLELALPLLLKCERSSTEPDWLNVPASVTPLTTCE